MENWFFIQFSLMKIVAMEPISFSFLPLRLKFLKYILNFFFYLFWHLIVIHLGLFLTITIILTFDKTLDELISFVMNGGIYVYGYLILCFWQFNRNKLLNLVSFVDKNFRRRSARGLSCRQCAFK